MTALILIVLAATLPMAPASPQDRANPPRKEQIEELPPVKAQVEVPAKTIKELQKERIATLKQMAEALTTLFQRGQVSFDDYLEAQLLVLKAELDAAEKEADRITVYKNTVDLLKQYEEIAKDRFQSARGPAHSVLKVRARRLEAEIDLERAKAKAAKKAK
ncbi:MAG TPA: hypothetical protein VH592_13505 [Gemmataceae bacterium]|jgi:outer membrane protein TolC